MSISAAVSPTWPSTTKMSTDASFTASAACASIIPGKISIPPTRSIFIADAGLRGKFSNPPVSTVMNSCSPQYDLTYMRSRVTPGSSYTIARFVPVKRLNNALLPTFGRPTMATRGSFSSGIFPHCRRVFRRRTASARSFCFFVFTPPPLSSSSSFSSAFSSSSSNKESPRLAPSFAAASNNARSNARASLALSRNVAVHDAAYAAPSLSYAAISCALNVVVVA
mmetsp:Transcript_7030/g.15690  ORF Transcript_7030/g.15690 Transcript_7030/m.15690 type:complete len:224 (+) Transcript_7030:2062-2733(+)